VRTLTVGMAACAVALITEAFPFQGIAHSGGLNAQGCHGGSQPYHCHRSSHDMRGNRLRCDLGSQSRACNAPARPERSLERDPSSGTNDSRASPLQMEDAVTGEDVPAAQMEEAVTGELPELPMKWILLCLAIVAMGMLVRMCRRRATHPACLPA